MGSRKRQHEDEHLGTRRQRLEKHPVDCDNKNTLPKYDTTRTLEPQVNAPAPVASEWMNKATHMAPPKLHPQHVAKPDPEQFEGVPQAHDWSPLSIVAHPLQTADKSQVQHNSYPHDDHMPTRNATLHPTHRAGYTSPYGPVAGQMSPQFVHEQVQHAAGQKQRRPLPATRFNENTQTLDGSPYKQSPQQGHHPGSSVAPSIEQARPTRSEPPEAHPLVGKALVDIQKLQLAQEWLHKASPTLCWIPHIVPPIPIHTHIPGSSIRSKLYLPQNAWTVRCMPPPERLSAYYDLCAYGKLMQMKTPGSCEWEITFDLVLEKSREIGERECQFYSQFSNPRHGSLNERMARYTALMTYQAVLQTDNYISCPDHNSTATPSTEVSSSQNIHNGVSPGTAIKAGDDVVRKKYVEKDEAPPSQGKKRTAPEPDHSIDAPTKKPRPEIDSAVKAAREAKAEEDHQRLVENKETILKWYLDGGRARKASDPEWQILAAWDAHRETKENPRSSRTPQPAAPQPRTQGAAYGNDTIDCPELPSRDLASYPLIREGIYRCLHIDSGCWGNTSCEKHPCCRRGHSLRELEKAVERKEERTCGRIEKYIADGKLDRRHKTWNGYFNADIRKMKNLPKPPVAYLLWTKEGRRNAQNAQNAQNALTVAHAAQTNAVQQVQQQQQPPVQQPPPPVQQQPHQVHQQQPAQIQRQQPVQAVEPVNNGSVAGDSGGHGGSASEAPNNATTPSHLPQQKVPLHAAHGQYPMSISTAMSPSALAARAVNSSKPTHKPTSKRVPDPDAEYKDVARKEISKGLRTWGGNVTVCGIVFPRKYLDSNYNTVLEQAVTALKKQAAAGEEAAKTSMRNGKADLGSGKISDEDLESLFGDDLIQESSTAPEAAQVPGAEAGSASNEITDDDLNALFEEDP